MIPATPDGCPQKDEAKTESVCYGGHQSYQALHKIIACEVDCAVALGTDVHEVHIGRNCCRVYYPFSNPDGQTGGRGGIIRDCSGKWEGRKHLTSRWSIKGGNDRENLAKRFRRKKDRCGYQPNAATWTTSHVIIVFRMQAKCEVRSPSGGAVRIREYLKGTNRRCLHAFGLTLDGDPRLSRLPKMA